MIFAPNQKRDKGGRANISSMEDKKLIQKQKREVEDRSVSTKFALQKYKNVFLRNAVKTLVYPFQWNGRKEQLIIWRQGGEWRGFLGGVLMQSWGLFEATVWALKVTGSKRRTRRGRWGWRSRRRRSEGGEVGEGGEEGVGRSWQSRSQGVGVLLQPQPRAPWCDRGGGRKAWWKNQI